MKNIERFEIIKVKRSQIKEAPYNPRTLSEDEEQKLRKSIKEYGLVEPLVWNKRTGNLIGGHQRLKILDDLGKGEDYDLTVAAVDVDEVTEKKINIILNNTLVQGDWDIEKLKDLVIEIKDVESIGFNDEEIKALLPFPEIKELFKEEQEDDEEETDETPQDTMDGEMDKLEKTQNKYLEWRKKQDKIDDSEFYIVLVFEDREQVDEFLTICGYNKESRFHDGRELLNRLKTQ